MSFLFHKTLYNLPKHGMKMRIAHSENRFEFIPSYGGGKTSQNDTTGRNRIAFVSDVLVLPTPHPIAAHTLPTSTFLNRNSCKACSSEYELRLKSSNYNMYRAQLDVLKVCLSQVRSLIAPQKYLGRCIIVHTHR